ncbi:hypothetical protein BH23CHL7_BH23CHL7_12170 [soil metagenome]
MIPLSEVNSAARANNVVIRPYIQNSAIIRSEHSLARLDVNYWLGNP